MVSTEGAPIGGLSAEQMREESAHLAMPDEVASPFGTLRFFDGVPLPETVTTLYDALDLVRGIDVFLNCMPAASLVTLRRGFRSIGVTSPRVIAYCDPRSNSRNFALTANTETTYATTFLDLKAWGPTVVEAPPQSLCFVDDFWFGYVADMGMAGPDRGEGGKYLYLPPGYDGDVPDGYFTYRSPTYTNWLVIRALGGIGDARKTRVYPLAEADAPAENEWVNWTDLAYNTVHANDLSFYREVDEVIQEEPADALDAERAGQLAAIGIVKGRPFKPDERRQRILDQAARIAAGMARAVAYNPRDPDATLYGSWKAAFIGGSEKFLRDGARLLDARAQFFYIATGITPAMAHAHVGTGSAYAYTAHDAHGDVLDGARGYRLHVDPDVPAQTFWAVDVYDTQTRSLLQIPSTIWPALSSRTGTLQANDDGSHDLYFGPTAPEGAESNWIETLPGKSWFAIVRIYGPLPPWFDQTWRLNDIEPMT